MELHERLRSLADQQGADVLADADGLRGALDDFLDEGSATAGQINVLVDAVRMGGLRRLLLMLDNGADPSAAVDAAGDSYARDRGTEDVDRSRWACAVLGYAVGALGVAEVHRYRGTTAESPGNPASPPKSAAETRQAAAGSRPAAAQTPAPSSVEELPLPDDVAATPHANRRRGWTVVAAVAVVTAAIIAVAVVVLTGNDDSADSATDADSGTDASTDAPGEAQGLPETVMVVQSYSGYPALDRILTFDVETGRQEDLANGTAPALSPDRSTVVYLKESAGGSARPYLLSIPTGRSRPLVPEGSECSYADEPAFSPSGDRVALVCERADGVPLGLYVVSVEGAEAVEVPMAGEPVGQPTWISESTIVYGRKGERGTAPTTLWSINADGTSQQQLTDASDGWVANPDWSSSRQLLIFERSRNPDLPGQIWLMAPGGRPSDLAVGFKASEPVWSPSGDEFAALQWGKTVLSFRIRTAAVDYPLDGREVPGQKALVGAPDWGSY